MASKGTPLVLILSLAANVALVTLIELKDPEVLRGDLFGKPAAVTPVVTPSSGTVGATATFTGPGAADRLLKGDPHTVIARLRAAGFPRSVLRAVARDMVNRQLHDREKAVADRIALKPYWKARFTDFDQGAMADMRALNRDRSKLVEELIGSDTSDSSPVQEVFMQGQRGGLSPEAYHRVDAIQSDYSDMKQKIYAGASGAMLPEDMEKLAYLKKQQAADLAAILSPDELLSYEMHVSPTSSTLRANLAAFNPTEDEFTALFRAQQSFDAQYGSPDGPLTQEQMQLRQAHQADLLAAVQQVLSPDRFAEYKTDTDPAFLSVDRLVQQLNLPPETTSQVVALQSDYSLQAAAIYSNSQISPADKITQLTALADDASAKLTAALGPRGLFAYEQSSGAWLQLLKAKGK